MRRVSGHNRTGDREGADPHINEPLSSSSHRAPNPLGIAYKSPPIDRKSRLIKPHLVKIVIFVTQLDDAVVAIASKNRKTGPAL